MRRRFRTHGEVNYEIDFCGSKPNFSELPNAITLASMTAISALWGPQNLDLITADYLPGACCLRVGANDIHDLSGSDRYSGA
jgi:hypothetical protein